MQKYRNQLAAGALFALTIYILYFFVAEYQFGAALSDTLRQFNWWLLPLLVSTQLMMVAFRFVAWQYYLGVIRARHRISIGDSFILFVSCFTLVISPGKAAEALKSVLLRAKTGVPFARSIPIVLAERIIDGLAVIALMVLALLFAGDQLNLGVYEGVDYDLLSRTIVFGSFAAIVSGLIIVQLKPLAYRVLNLIYLVPLLRRAYRPLLTFYESSRMIFQLRHVIPMTFVGIGVYFASVLCFILVLYGFGFDITWQLALQATFIVGVTSAVGALSFVPNGAGVTEVTNIGMLMAVVAPVEPSMTPAVAVSASLIQGFFHKWLRVLFGLGIAIIFRKRLFTPAAQEALQEFEMQEARQRHGVELAPT
jgi:uncharacterized protein (TIRG00374 family)